MTNNQRLNVLFFGTPQIAVPYLAWLIQNTDVVGVVCRSDEPVGRGYQLTAPPTKILAQQNNIPVFQPTGPWSDSTIQALRDLKADIGIVVAYGRIMPRPVFMAPRLGCVNIHFSLLPKYRGAAPMQWALINGENKTGVTAFWLEEGLDSGPVFHCEEISIDTNDRTPELRDKLVPLGINVMERVIHDVKKGILLQNDQVGDPSFAPLLKKELGQINWELPAKKIVNLVRGVCEWPGAVTRFSPEGGESRLLKIHRSVLIQGSKGKKPGTIVEATKEIGFVVQAGQDAVLITDVQPEGKKRMPAWTFWQGARLKVGDRLG